jgi:two-component sensor histidine kinase
VSSVEQIDFERLLSKSPNPYVLLDRDLRIAWMNDAYLAITMRSHDDLLGLGMFEAFPSDPASESFTLLNESLHRVLRNGTSDEIALIRYDIARPDGTLSEMYWSATHTPVLDDRGATAFILQHTVDVTELHSLRRARDEMSLVQRADAVQARNIGLRQESAQLKAMFEQAPGFVAVVEGPEHVFRMANASYRRLVAGRDIVGHSVKEAIPEVVDQGFISVLDDVHRDGRAYVGQREQVMLKQEGSDAVELRYLNFIFQPIRQDDTVSGIIIQGYDVTDEVDASDAQRLLIDELNHRVKNTLAIVQGLAAQSFRELDGAETARRSFDSRLNALAAAHSLLTARNWESAMVADIVDGAIEAAAGSGASRVQISGPPLSLDPQVAVSLSMLTHELATNAIKYGALSNDFGRVSVEWTLDPSADDRTLVITWAESDGPPVVEPVRRGFGSRLIQRGLSTQGRSSVHLRFDPDGLQCRIVAQLETGAR